MNEYLTAKEVRDILKDLPQNWPIKDHNTTVREVIEALALLDDNFQTLCLKNGISTVHEYPTDKEYVIIKTKKS